MGNTYKDYFEYFDKVTKEEGEDQMNKDNKPSFREYLERNGFKKPDDQIKDNGMFSNWRTDRSWENDKNDE